MSRRLSMVSGQTQDLNAGILILEPCLHLCCIGRTRENTNIDLLPNKNYGCMLSTECILCSIICIQVGTECTDPPRRLNQERWSPHYVVEGTIIPITIVPSMKCGPRMAKIPPTKPASGEKKKLCCFNIYVANSISQIISYYILKIQNF